MSDSGSKPRRLIEVVAALLWQDGRLLITQRPDDADLGGLWEFPGGKVEPGESYEQALQRELREELAIEVEVGELYGTAEYELPPDRLVRLYFFTCCLVAGTPTLLWSQALRWIAPAELADYSFPPADVELVARLSG